jgi:hypothetical protein
MGRANLKGLAFLINILSAFFPHPGFFFETRIFHYHQKGDPEQLYCSFGPGSATAWDHIKTIVV